MNRQTRRAAAALAGALAILAMPALAADHPGSDSDCASCHGVKSETPDAPRVIPAEPGFFARLFGGKSLRGHPSVSCAGEVGADGSVGGCHRPEAGGQAYLVLGGTGKPSDALCGTCHAPQRVPGAHHPSYLADRDGDGTPESPVRPAEGQEVYGSHAAGERGFDALEFRTAEDGTRSLLPRIPLETGPVPVDDGFVEQSHLVTCTSCHNPHFGYLVEVGSEEELNAEQVAREQGDALLRLRDFDNALCDACH
jgi:hypothetical protein